MNAQSQKYHCGLVKHILLLIFTFGIWQLIWIHRMTEYLNGAEGEPHRTPTNQLLLCMFVPFYVIYWVYQSAQRIDKMAHAKGIESDLTILCLVLEIFIAIVPPILMQDKINQILTAPAGATPLPAKSAPPQNVPAASAVTYQPTAPVMGAADEIKKFKELLDSGALTEEEFTMKKRQILGLPMDPPAQKASYQAEEFDDLPEL